MAIIATGRWLRSLVRAQSQHRPYESQPPQDGHNTKILAEYSLFRRRPHIYNRFWKQPLKFEELVVCADDGSGMKVEQSFTVLMIDDRLLPRTKEKLLVRHEYRDALTALENYCELDPLSGGIILGYPGIGGCLHDKFPVALASALFWLNFFLLVSRLSKGKKTIMNQSAGHRIYLFDESGLSYFTGTFVSDLITGKLAYQASALVDSYSSVRPLVFPLTAHSPKTTEELVG